MNKVWQELTHMALMGTERSQLSEETKTALKARGISLGSDEARIILEGASFYAMIQKAAFEPPTWNKAIIPPGKEEKDLPGQACSLEATHCLHQILDGTFAPALQEFIRLLQSRHQQLPPEVLPDLLQQCRQSPALWDLLRPCLGTRGMWLVQQNPEWLFLQEKPDLVLYETGTRDQRKALLKNLRTSNPRQARALIESTWATEDVNSRIEFLKIIAITLTPEDEDFLEDCLDDRRKEVRQLAAQILAQLPQSALVERMYQRVIGLLQVSQQGKKVKLKVDLPEELSEGMLRDGIDPRNQWYQGGVKASRLGQMFAVVPPHFWEKHFAKEPLEILNIFLQSNWGLLLFTASSMAAALHHNEAWMKAILLTWFKYYDQEDWQNVDVQNVIPSLPAEVFNEMAFQGLSSNPELIENTAPVGILLKEVEQPWEDRLSILFFKTLKNWLKQNPGQYWSAWHFWNILEKAAYLIRPELYPTFVKAFDQDAIWYQAAEELDKFMHILKFRKKMHDAFVSPEARNPKS